MHHVHPPAVSTDVLMLWEKDVSHEKNVDDCIGVPLPLRARVRVQGRVPSMGSGGAFLYERVRCRNACV